MLLKKEQSCLMLIDVQEKLTPLILQSDALVNRCQWLMQLAKELAVPLLLNEQYPQGLGPTISSLKSLVPEQDCLAKLCFSSFAEPKIRDGLFKLNKKQIILMGIETHVCVLQTAMDLLAADYEVFVVVDAVGSRQELDHKYGLKRMKQAGIELITAEMVFFEWLKEAGTPEFKRLSKAFF